MRPAVPVIHAGFGHLGLGGAEVQSLHFDVHAYGENHAHAVSRAAEADYTQLMMDTNLISFYQPSGLLGITDYSGPAEYHEKTKAPEWSGGVCVGDSVYVYDGAGLWPTLAHELTHVVFYEYMADLAFNPEFRWVNEGLATYEECKAAGAQEGVPFVDIFAPLRGALRRHPLSIHDLVKLVPAQVDKDYTVSLWYAQAEALVQYMIQKGGTLGFYQFLKALKSGKTLDEAVALAFPNRGWASLGDLYGTWLATQQ
jgi:hypothetical protein